MFRRQVPRIAGAVFAAALVAARWGLADQPGDDQYAVAARHYADGRWELAAEEFQKLLAEHADHPRAADAIFFRGEALVQLEKFAEARQAFQTLLERQPRGARARQALFRSGETALLAGDKAQARRQLLSFAEQHVDDPLMGYVLPYLGELALEANEPAEAQQHYARALDKFPQGALVAESRLGLGRALGKLGRHDEALAALKPLFDDPSWRGEARYRWGLLQKARREWGPAVETLRRAAQLDPRHELAAAMLFHAADAQLQDGKLDDAAATFADTLKSHADGPWADDCLLGQLQIALRRGRHEEAAELGERLLTKFPRSELRADAELLAATALSAQAKHDQAADLLQSSLDHAASDDQRARARGALAVCQARRGKPDEAKRLYAQLRGDASHAELARQTAAQLADVAAAAGNVAWAAELAASVPSDNAADGAATQTLWALARSQFQAGDFAACAATLDKLGKSPPEVRPGDVALLRGQTLEKLGQLDAALAVYRALIEAQAPDELTVQALWLAGKLHEKLDQHQPADQCYQRIAAEYAKSDLVDDALHARALLARRLGRSTEAQSLWRQLRRDHVQSPLWPDAAYRLAELAVDERRYDEAEKLLADAQLAQPKAALVQHTLYLQGRLALVRQRWAEVSPPLARLVHDYPESSLAWSAQYLIAESLYRQGDYAGAGDRFAQLDEQPRQAEPRWRAMVRLRRAQSLGQLGEWQRAQELAAALAKDFPDFRQSYEVDYLLGRCLAAKADFDGARAAYQRVVKSTEGGKTETAAMAQWMIGESYFHQENYAQALREYLRVEALYGYPRWQAAALLQAGKCQEQLGRWPEAGKLYAQLAQRFPHDKLADEAARRERDAREHERSGRRASGSSQRQ